MSKKILIVTNFYEPHKSGIITYIKQEINSLKKKNYQITILTTKHKKYLLTSETFNDINIIRCKPTLSISRGFYSFELIKKFLILKKKYDIINLHLPISEIFPLIFFINKNKTIITYHCLPQFPLYLKFLKFYFYVFGFLSLLLSKKISVLSKDYFNHLFLHKYFEKKVIEAPPFILPNKNLTNDKVNKNLRIGYLGRLSNEKGLEYLIDASDKMALNNINHSVVIAGDVNDTRFIKYINKLKRSSNKYIKFVGKINEEEKKQFYNNIDIFILPSTNSFEAFGIVQLEAMSYGVPVIASNIPGVRSIINRTNNGYLFENRNKKDLYKTILSLKNHNFKSEIVKKNVHEYYNESLFDFKISKIFS